MKQNRPPLTAIPAEIRCAQDYEIVAEHFLAPDRHAYIAGGCGREITLAANRSAFDATRLWPRLLRELGRGHTAVDLFGRRLVHPILLAPLAYQTLAHVQGEIDVARGAAATDSGFVLSTLAGRTLEEVALHAGEERWFQLYFQAERRHTLDLVKRAEAAAYRVLVVTLDTAIKLPSLRAQRAGFVMPEQVVAASLANYPEPAPCVIERGQSRVFQGVMAQAPGWDDLDWLLSQTRLPVVVKGVLHPDDAQKLQARGVAGIIVSNHGGRSLDGAPASLAVLPAIRAAVGASYPLLLDSGIRSGGDVFKALALGADAVLVGRLQIYALAVAGALGVAHMLRLLREELEVCMAQAGCATLADIGPAMIFKETEEETRC